MVFVVVVFGIEIWYYWFKCYVVFWVGVGVDLLYFGVYGVGVFGFWFCCCWFWWIDIGLWIGIEFCFVFCIVELVGNIVLF